MRKPRFASFVDEATFLVLIGKSMQQRFNSESLMLSIEEFVASYSPVEKFEQEVS